MKKANEGRDRLLAFMTARHAIYLARASGQPKPWTKDKILRRYRFCNVYRELDKVTIWIDEHIRKPFVSHPQLWFMLALARQINHPETLAELMKKPITWPGKNGWSVDETYRAMRSRQERGAKLYTGAYMLNCVWPTDWNGYRDKATFTTQLALLPLWQDRRRVEAALHGTLERACQAFLPYRGWGTFMAAQVVADLKHTRYLRGAADWWEWAAPGPGSHRGLNRVLGVHVDEPCDDRLWLDTVLHIKAWINGRWPHTKLCAQDIQNCLCEFDKYERARLGEGKPRATYDGE